LANIRYMLEMVWIGPCYYGSPIEDSYRTDPTRSVSVPMTLSFTERLKGGMWEAYFSGRSPLTPFDQKWSNSAW